MEPKHIVDSCDEEDNFDFDEREEKQVLCIEGQNSNSIKYVFGQKLGEGSSGKVKLAIRSDTKTKVAIKIFKKSILRKQKELIQTPSGTFRYKDALQDVLLEVAIMKKLRHPNILKLYDVVDDVEADKFYMILEYAEGGQIIEWDADSAEFYPLITEGFIPEDELRHIFYGCVDGLVYLHQNNIIHRDIKPQNVLLDSKKIPKISDFGVSAIKEGGSDNLTGTFGTRQFLSPEIIKSESNEKYSGRAADIWALTCTFYCFVFHRLPFWDDNLLDLFKKIEATSVTFPSNRKISPALEDFLMRGLDKNPATRITLEGMLAHPFLSGISHPEWQIDESVKVSPDEVNNALKPFTTIILCKVLANKLMHNGERRASGSGSLQKKASKIKDANNVAGKTASTLELTTKK